MPKDEKQYLLDLGALICTKRKAKDLTQEDLAKKVGLSRNQIHRIEDGQNATNIITLRRIAMVLDITLEQLVRPI